MNLEQTIEQDIKTAMLAGESDKVTTLRGIKSVLLNAKVALGKRDVGLTDDEVIDLLAKETKKRQESADLYVQGGDQSRADKELAEKALIETYLPAQLSEVEVSKIIDEVIASSGADGPAAMGQVIGQVKARTRGTADGSVIANLVKQKLTNPTPGS